MKQIKATGGHKHLAWISSENDAGVEYEVVERLGSGLKCSCMGWAFSKDKPKGCKHIIAYQAWPGPSSSVVVDPKPNPVTTKAAASLRDAVAAGVMSVSPSQMSLGKSTRDLLIERVTSHVSAYLDGAGTEPTVSRVVNGEQFAICRSIALD